MSVNTEGTYLDVMIIVYFAPIFFASNWLFCIYTFPTTSLSKSDNTGRFIELGIWSSVNSLGDLTSIIVSKLTFGVQK